MASNSGLPAGNASASGQSAAVQAIRERNARQKRQRVATDILKKIGFEPSTGSSAGNGLYYPNAQARPHIHVGWGGGGTAYMACSYSAQHLGQSATQMYEKGKMTSQYQDGVKEFNEAHTEDASTKISQALTALMTSDGIKPVSEAGEKPKDEGKSGAPAS